MSDPPLRPVIPRPVIPRPVIPRPVIPRRAIPRRAIPRRAIPWGQSPGGQSPGGQSPAGQSLAERRAATARTPRRAACCRPYADAGAAEAANNTGGAGTCSIAARANAAAKRICRTPGRGAASASSVGAISGGSAAFSDRDRRPGSSRRRVSQRRGHCIGAIILRTRRQCGRQRCGASAGCDVRSRLSRPCRCPRQPRRPRSGRVLVPSSP